MFEIESATSEYSTARQRVSAVCLVILVALVRVAPLCADDAAGRRYVNPAQVWWDASLDQFVIWQWGPHAWAGVSRQGAVTQAIQPPDVPNTACARVLSPGKKWVAWIDVWQPVLHILEDRKTRAITVEPRPQALSLDPDGKTIWVACDSIDRARSLCRVDVASGQVMTREIPGASNLQGVAVSPDGQFAIVTHLIPKSNLPSSQIEQGWVFTNAVTLVPRADDQPLVTIPLDLRTQAFANPASVVISPDGQFAWISHTGADVVSLLDVQAARTLVPSSQPLDLTLTRRYVRARIPVGSAPAGVALSADGRKLAVANRLDDSVFLIDTQTRRVTHRVLLPDDLPANDLVRRGERLFFSASLAYAGQFSCASCHPGGHADGLNWDLPADGFNNFQNTKSLLDIDGTVPYGWLGKSDSLTDRFSGTLRHLFQHEPPPEEAEALDAYLSQLRYPARRVPAELNDRDIAAGRMLFHGQARCADCHSGDKFTDRKMHDVLGAGLEIDTPSLLRIGETAPYLHNGRARTLESIFENHNAAGLHGNAAELTPANLRSLVAYLKSL